MQVLCARTGGRALFSYHDRIHRAQSGVRSLASCWPGPIARPTLILVVHSDPWVRTTLYDALSRAGWSVKQASNGATGARLAAQLLPRLIVVGPDLSELGASDLAELLHSQARTREILVVPIGVQPGAYPAARVSPQSAALVRR